MGVVDTDPIGLSLGRITRSLVVLASSLSFGTRNATTLNPPPSVEPGWTVTWASAAPDDAKTAAPAARRGRPTLRSGRRSPVEEGPVLEDSPALDSTVFEDMGLPFLRSAKIESSKSEEMLRQLGGGGGSSGC
jgi:hypothetical protein